MFTVQGHSDDVVSFEVDGVHDEVSEPAAFLIGDEKAGLVVTVDYCPKLTGCGGWRIGFSPVDEDVPLPPEWQGLPSIRISGYTAVGLVPCPKGTQVRKLEVNRDRKRTRWIPIVKPDRKADGWPSDEDE